MDGGGTTMQRCLFEGMGKHQTRKKNCKVVISHRTRVQGRVAPLHREATGLRAMKSVNAMSDDEGAEVRKTAKDSRSVGMAGPEDFRGPVENHQPLYRAVQPHPRRVGVVVMVCVVN